MATKSLTAKLGIKPDNRVCVLNAPPSYAALLRESGTKVTLTKQLSTDVQVILLFAGDRSSLERSLKTIKALMQPSALLWVCYQKGQHGIPGALNRDVIRLEVPALGFQVVALIAVDDTWSALRLKRRNG